MSGESPERDRVEGVVLYPPVLGLERTPDGPRARLANTIRVDDVDATIVFRGDRAEVAERLLRTGDRRIRSTGVWDDDRAVFTVDRFDVLDADPSHRYRIDRQHTAAPPVDVDVTSLYETDGLPEAVEQTGRAIAENAERRRQEPSPEPVRGASTAEPAAAGGGHSLAPGRRVVARDRGNTGTVVAVDPDTDEIRVRFMSRSGRTTVRTFTLAELDVADRPPGPQVGPSPPAHDDRSPAPELRPGDSPGRDEPVTERPPRRRPLDPRPAPEHEAGTGQVDPGHHSPTEGDVPAPARVERTGPEERRRVLRVHTRRIEPTGELLL